MSEGLRSYAKKPYIEDIMIDTSASILTQISQAIRQAEPQAEIILFGSRARGDARPNSDWDVLVLLDGKVTPEREEVLFKLLYQIELATEEVFSLLVYEKNYWQQVLKDGPLYQNVNQEGIVLV